MKWSKTNQLELWKGPLPPSSLLGGHSPASLPELVYLSDLHWLKKKRKRKKKEVQIRHHTTQKVKSIRLFLVHVYTDVQEESQDHRTLKQEQDPRAYLRCLVWWGIPTAHVVPWTKHPSSLHLFYVPILLHTHFHECPVVIHLICCLQEVASICPHGCMLFSHNGST